MILIILAALAINSAAAYRARQQLHDVLLAAANDGAAAGLSDASFYARGVLELTPGVVDREACLSISAQGASALEVQAVYVSVSGLWVQVSGSAAARGLFARGLPGLGRIEVASSATAVVAEGPNGSAVPPVFSAPQRVAC